MLFEEEEEEDRLIAVSVLQAHASQTADLVVLAVHEDVQGGWLRQEPSRPLCVAVLEETVRFAACEGYERIIAIAAEQNTQSVRLITGAGFTRVTQLDGDYILYRAVRPAIEDARLTRGRRSTGVEHFPRSEAIRISESG